jgi:hypothetical protein
MKSVILGNDFLKDTDGSFKMLETNTSCAFPTKNMITYLNKEVFDTFLSNNGIEEIDIITTGSGMISSIDESFDDSLPSTLTAFLNEHYGQTHSIRYWKSGDSDTIPNVEDAPNKLIIRVAYDTNALVDDTYCRDNFNFLKLMYDNDPNSIPKTYFNNGEGLSIDSIGLSFRDNGVYPNFIIKKRFPVRNYSVNPIILKVNSEQEVQSLKDNLQSDEILQEYIINTNDLLVNRIKTYRQYSFLYGGSLDTLDLFEPIVITNRVELSQNVDYNDSNHLQPWERPKLIQKVGELLSRDTYHGSSENTIILGDGSTGTVGGLNVGDSVKTISLYGLGPDDHYVNWSESKENILQNSTLTTAQVVNTITKTTGLFFMRLNFTDGTSHSDVDKAEILTISNGVGVFKQMRSLMDGDEVVVGSINSNILTTKIIQSNEYFFDVVDGFTIDVEEEDVYLRPLDGTATDYVIKHNKQTCRCWYKEVDYVDCVCNEPCISPPDECESGNPMFIDCCQSEPDCFGGGSYAGTFCGPNK